MTTETPAPDPVQDEPDGVPVADVLVAFEALLEQTRAIRQHLEARPLHDPSTSAGQRPYPVNPGDVLSGANRVRLRARLQRVAEQHHPSDERRQEQLSVALSDAVAEWFDGR